MGNFILGGGGGCGVAYSAALPRGLRYSSFESGIRGDPQHYTDNEKHILVDVKQECR